MERRNADFARPLVVHPDSRRARRREERKKKYILIWSSFILPLFVVFANLNLSIGIAL